MAANCQTSITEIAFKNDEKLSIWISNTEETDCIGLQVVRYHKN